MTIEAETIPLELSETDQKKVSGAAWHIARHYEAEQGDIESRLTFALHHAVKSYNPDFGVPLEAYKADCLQHEIKHYCRKLKKRFDESRHTRHFADKIRGDWTLGDTLCTRRGGPAKMWRALEIREWLNGLRGTDWLVAIASLCGFRASDIALKLGMPRTSYDRKFGPLFDTLRG